MQALLFHVVCLEVSSRHLHRTFPALAEAAHVAIAGQEGVAARDWLCGLLKRIEATRMFNAPIDPSAIQQDGESLATRDILAINRVIEAVTVSREASYECVHGVFWHNLT